jgi:hypothetical protein
MGRLAALQQGTGRRAGSGAPRPRDTAINPAVLDAFALAISGARSSRPIPAWPATNPTGAGAPARAGNARAMDELRKVVPRPGSYVSESNYFEPDWQRSFWGANYARLLAVKTKYDPEGLFFVHHGVGSERWSADGFTRRVDVATAPRPTGTRRTRRVSFAA